MLPRFEEPTIKVIVFEISDVLTASGPGDTIELPDVPQTISDTGYYASSCKVTGITYKVSGDDVTFYFTGEKTYDKNGNGYSQSCKIGWKLYDEDGYVVDSGTCYTTSIKVGEKFKDAKCNANNVIEQGKTYRLVIMNVS